MPLENSLETSPLSPISCRGFSNWDGEPTSATMLTAVIASIDSRPAGPRATESPRCGCYCREPCGGAYCAREKKLTFFGRPDSARGE
jgi:hypothetical protein